MIAQPAIVRPAVECHAHGRTRDALVWYCVTRLGNDRCRLRFLWRTADSLNVHSFGGIVPCGVSTVSDPGDRRPK